MTKNKRGFTLTELAIVLGIIGTILGAIWVAASKVNNNQRAAKAVQQVLAISNGVRAIYGPKGVVETGDLTTTMVSFGVYPIDMIKPTGCPTGMTSNCPISPWGGLVKVGGYNTAWGSAPSAQTDVFNIQYTATDMPNCGAFLAQLISSGDGNGPIWLSATGVVPTAISTAVSLSDVAACSGSVVLQFQL